MKIGTPLDAQAAAGVSLRTGRAPAGPGAVAPGGVAATDRVAVSAAGAQMGAATGDFDAAKVEAIRQAIREGRFTVNPGAIADRLIADAAALLGPRGA